MLEKKQAPRLLRFRSQRPTRGIVRNKKTSLLRWYLQWHIGEEIAIASLHSQWHMNGNPGHRWATIPLVPSLRDCWKQAWQSHGAVGFSSRKSLRASLQFFITLFKPNLKQQLSKTENVGLGAGRANSSEVIGITFASIPASFSISQAKSYQEHLPELVAW